jgi:hypothetical protein
MRVTNQYCGADVPSEREHAAVVLAREDADDGERHGEDDPDPTRDARRAQVRAVPRQERPEDATAVHRERRIGIPRIRATLKGSSRG